MLSALIRSMRPKQWTKNLIVFAPVIFAGRLLHLADVERALAAFVLLCLVSGAVYVLNDLKDVEGDRLHVAKRARPIASGALRAPTALVFALGLTALAMVAAWALKPMLALTIAAYFLLQVVYTLYAKDEVILDVMSIATGFVLRAVAGAVVIAVPSSPWLLTCAALLALFLGLAKRRHELLVLEDEAPNHRAALAHYTPAFIDEMVSAVASATIVSYALYTFFSAEAGTHPYMMLTVPFVVYGLFRYLYLMHLKKLGGSPEEILLTDVPLIIDILLWLASVSAVIYFV